MRRRLGRIGLSFLVLNVTSCALVNLIALPFQVIFKIFGAAASAVGLGYATPPVEPPPLVQSLGGEQWLVSGLRPEVPCRIVVSAPERDPVAFAWPDDFGGRGGEVTVAFQRSE